jgi:DNA-binding NarL/FixJ family response regulator
MKSIVVGWRLAGMRGALTLAESASGEVAVSVNRISVFLLAENCLLREALARFFRKKEDIDVVGALPYSLSALETLSAANPDVALFDSADIALTGPRVVSHLRRAKEKTKAIMVGMEQDETMFLTAVGEGVLGYVLKDASATEIIRVVRAVSAGEAVCPPCFSLSLFQCAAQEISFLTNRREKTQFGLTRREQQLIGLIRMGLTNKEIGNRLNLSEQTVKNHIHRALRKAGASDRLEIVEKCRDADVPRLSLS